MNKSDVLAYGKYLTTIASCGDCHTKQENGKYVEGMQLAGGREFNIKAGIVRSSNITPDLKTGIGGWSKEIFIRRFKYFEADSAQNIAVGKSEFNTPMPWTMYTGMTEEDLGAIFQYLATTRAVENNVEKWTPSKK